jgi:hypothetical protein
VQWRTTRLRIDPPEIQEYVEVASLCDVPALCRYRPGLQMFEGSNARAQNSTAAVGQAAGACCLRLPVAMPEHTDSCRRGNRLQLGSNGALTSELLLRYATACCCSTRPLLLDLQCTVRKDALAAGMAQCQAVLPAQSIAAAATTRRHRQCLSV